MLREKTLAMIFAALLVLPLIAGLVLGAVFSLSYWGFAFARPVAPEAAVAKSVDWIMSLDARDNDPRCRPGAPGQRSLQDAIATYRRYIGDFPYGQVLIDLDDKGLLPGQYSQPNWLDLEGLRAAALATGIIVRGEPGYDQSMSFGGHALGLTLDSDRHIILLIASGPQVSNDYYPIYEIVLEQNGDQLLAVRTRRTFHDIAGIEGFEWPISHLLIGIGAAPFTTTLVLLGALIARRRQEFINAAQRNALAKSSELHSRGESESDT